MCIERIYQTYLKYHSSSELCFIYMSTVNNLASTTPNGSMRQQGLNQLTQSRALKINNHRESPSLTYMNIYELNQY